MVWKAWQSVKSTTGSIYNQTKQKYSDASDKAWAHSKSICSRQHQNGLATHIKVQRVG